MTPTAGERSDIVIVTGASGGIGAALAARLARPGRAVGLVGRNAAGLAAAAERVSAAGGTPVLGRLDLTGAEFPSWLDGLASRHRIAAVYANAGLSAGPPSPGELETAGDTARLVEVNLLATIATVRETVARMRGEPGPKRVGIVSSVAGLLPTPDLAVYSATKAALIAYAHAIRPRLAAEGISVSVLCPGFVTSPMSARHIGSKPFEISADDAAGRIVAAVERGRRTTVFPLPFALLATFAPLAPGALIDRLVPSFKATILPDERSTTASPAASGAPAER